jgi:general nucleoside transport system permease protein
MSLAGILPVSHKLFLQRLCNLLSHIISQKNRYRYFKEITFTIFIAFMFSTLLIFLSGASPLSVYFNILKGSLGSWTKLSHVLKAWVPLTLCACGLLYTFRIGLWNIGIEGQMVMGAVFTTAILRVDFGSGMNMLHILIAITAGALGGAGWAAVAGLFKTRGGVNEIFAGLGLNFLAQGITLWLIFGPWKRQGIASMSGTEVFSKDLWLPYIAQFRLSPPALIMAVAAVFLTALLLFRTKLGLKLKAVGNNAKASFLLGLKPDRLMIYAMLFAGGFAGLAGSVQVTGVYHRLIPSISSNYGYLALLIVMLADYNIRLTPFIAFVFACLNVGSIQLPMMLQLDSSLAGIIQGALVLSILAVTAMRARKKAEGDQ